MRRFLNPMAALGRPFTLFLLMGVVGQLGLDTL
jgi:hypothetical protein